MRVFVSLFLLPFPTLKLIKPRTTVGPAALLSQSLQCVLVLPSVSLSDVMRRWVWKNSI